MGYSANPELVERRRHFLTQLERGIQSSWIVEEDLKLTNQYAWEIREALYIASQYPERFPGLAKAHKDFSINVVRAGRIEAKPKKNKGQIQIALDDDDEVRTPTGAGLKLASEIIDLWNSRHHSNDPLACLDTVLSIEELTKLHEWTEKAPKKLILIDDTSKFITITLFDKSVEEFAWHPEKKEEEISMENLNL